MSAILLMRFNEPAQIQPSDELGNLDDMRTEAAITMPARANAWTGGGRTFTQPARTGLIAADRSANGTLLQRDVTVQALLSLTLSGASGPQTLIVRGTNDGSTSERYSYGLELQEQAAFPGYVEMRWYWQDSFGVVHAQPPGVFKSPGDGVEFLLTATRRWESTSRVVVRYYVGAELIAEIVSANGDISGGTTGHTTIGVQKSAGSYGRFFNGTIDEVLITDDEMSLEEVRHTWARLAEYQPGGVETFAALSPPGSSWAKPGTDIGKRVKLVGQLLGLAVAAAEELRALLLPDAAPLVIIQRWERICELAAAPADSLDVRRARVLAFLARDEGFQLPAIQTALSGPMGLAPELIEVVEFTNTITDGFTDGISAERWFDGGGATWTATAGELHAVASAGSDLRWESRASAFLLTPAELGRIYVSARLEGSDLTHTPTGSFYGLALHDRATGAWLWYGIWNRGGALALAWRVVNGATASPFRVLQDVPAAGPFWLRIASDQRAPFVDNGLLQLGYSATGADSGFAFFMVQVVPPTHWTWAGFALSSTSVASGTAIDAKFSDFTLHNADGLRPYLWYALRDRALPGTTDLTGANLLVQKIKPAYTFAAAVMSRSVLCDDVRDGLCDRGPLGAL